MGIIRLTLFTVGAVAAAMVHFGRDNDLPVDRIGREPTIAQETIVPVSAAIEAETTDVITDGGETVVATPVATAQVQPTKASLSVTPVAFSSATTPQSQAEKAEAAARLMASKIATTTPAVAVATNLDPNTAFVSGNTVNMRAGPTTSHGVVAKLTRGTEVIDMGSAGDGWSQIKVVDTGARGFMASRFLKSQL